jgi:hypothetical protein
VGIPRPPFGHTTTFFLPLQLQRDIPFHPFHQQHDATSRCPVRTSEKEKASLDRDHIGRLERGEIAGESRPRTIRALAQALGVEPSELVHSE